jgi:protoporphyrinogen oxidase
MARVGIVGAGIMGLAAAHRALQRNHEVVVFEADDRPGGMSAHFDLGGLSIERFYHFICKSDDATFALLAELGIADALQWRDTSMGYFIDGAHFNWGDPLALLAFPKLDIVSKFRYGLHALWCTWISDWSALDRKRAPEWLRAWVGARAFDLLWQRLFRLKFHQYAEEISAAWVWSRIKRVGTSRRSMFHEQLGFLDGGAETLIRALVAAIEQAGGRIHLSQPVEAVEAADGKVTGIRARGMAVALDQVICTLPTPYVSRTVPALPPDLKARYDAIANIGVVCVVFRLARPVSRHFWINIVDETIDIPGIIEFSNLRPLPDPVVYVPYYLPPEHAKFGRSDAEFLDEAFGYLRRLNPALDTGDIRASKVGRLRHAQPICTPGFLEKLPAVQSPIAGLQIADTSYYYPEDRGISESTRFGRAMAERIV